MKFKHPFLRVLHDLGDAADAVVLVGGWVPTVYFEYLWGGNFVFGTKDIDIGLNSAHAMEPPIQERLVHKDYTQRHLNLGKSRPYQLLLERKFPIDFLTDTSVKDQVAKEVLGTDIILNNNPEYQFVLDDTMTVNCEGLTIRIPKPARYIAHKISVYLSSEKHRTKDLPMAYYCLSRSPEKESILQSLQQLRTHAVIPYIKRELAPHLHKASFAVKDVQDRFMDIGIVEPEEDILFELETLHAAIT